MAEFQAFQKIARLSRDCVVTEKIDGTNAQVFIVPLFEAHQALDTTPWLAKNNDFALAAGSRTRWITPEADNHGFARWAKDHAEELFGLGPGRHFGEWWGSGIQRGYGLPKGEKRFSLFNVSRWHEAANVTPATTSSPAPACCHVVPTMYTGTFDSFMVHEEFIMELRQYGSLAAPGFMDPEGIVVFHVASGQLFKKTLANDGVPKGLVNA